MATLAFPKGHGRGNVFVVVSAPDGELALPDGRVAILCDRHFGIGADGLLRVVRSSAIDEGADAAASGAEWFMDYRNADGSKAEMCGNGTRVFARYLTDTGLAEISGGLRIGTRAGVKTLARSDSGVAGFRLERRLLAQQIGRMVAGPTGHAAAIDVHDPRGQLAQKHAIVRDQHEGFFITP